MTTAGRTVGAAPTAGRQPAAPHRHRPRRRSAPGVRGRQARAGCGPPRETCDCAVTEGRESNLVLFCVDASGSMAARRRMDEVKTAVLSLLLDAYQRRDKVGLVTFRGSGATLALPPTSSVDVAAARRLEDAAQRRPHPARRGPALRGGNPSAGSGSATRAAGRCWSWSPTAGPPPAGRAAPVAGRPPTSSRRPGIASLVVDCETGRFRMGLARAAGRATCGPTYAAEVERDRGEVLHDGTSPHRSARAGQGRLMPRAKPTSCPPTG